MRYTILFVIALVLVSGFIAYFGDRLGRVMGKKRLTLFRMRPRHTAVLVTTLTGMLISALALTALVSVNSQFRHVLTRGEQILAQNQNLITLNEVLDTKNKQLVQQGKALEKQVEVRQKEVDRARTSMEKAQGDVQRLKKDIEVRKVELEKLRARGDVAEEELAKRVAELETLQKELGDAEQELASAEQELKGAETRLADAQSGLEQAQVRLKETEDELKSTESELAVAKYKLVELNRAKEQFKEQTIKLRSRDFVYRQGDEIARGSINPKQSPFGLRAELYSLLETASQKAQDAGAIIGSNGRAVAVVYQQIVSADYALVIDDEETCVDMAARTISGSPEDVLIQVVCGMNTLAGEQVKVDLRLYLNRLVFKKGAWIAQTEINGRMSEGRILLEVINFLQNDVTRAALKAGIIPVSNPDPRSGLGRNPREQVDALIAEVERVKAINAPVNVNIYSCEDIYAAEPLDMDNKRFSITKAE